MSYLAWPPRKKVHDSLCVSSVFQFLRNPTKLQRNVFSWTIQPLSFAVSPSFSFPLQGETVPSMQSQHVPPPKKHLRDTVSCEQTWLWSPPGIQTETRTKTLRGSDSGLILHVLTKWEGKPSRLQSGNRPCSSFQYCILVYSAFFLSTHISKQIV